MSNGTGNYFMNLPRNGESGGQILAEVQPIGTGTTGANYQSIGTTSSFPPYNFSFLGGKKKRISLIQKRKSKYNRYKTRKSRKSRKSRK